MGKYLTLAKLYQRHNLLINKLIPNYYLVKLHSRFRAKFMRELYQQTVPTSYKLDDSLAVTLWGIKFRHPLLNSAGMFKNGEGYELVERQGAGGYIGGTSTHFPRLGNVINGITHPFLSFGNISVNSLGLPNKGDNILSSLNFNKQDGCPIGWSIMQVVDSTLQQLIKSAFMYHDNLNIDFLEINVSCPNVKHDATPLEGILTVISNKFLNQRRRNFPVVVKLSNDVELEDLPSIIKLLIKYKFDGVNLGNTSINYVSLSNSFKNDPALLDLFNYFTNKFGGGVSGNVLKSHSLLLCKSAVDIVNSVNPSHEFHVIRTGGIDTMEDLLNSRRIGVSLNQWYTGYIHNYIKFGHSVYKNIYQNH